jgi:hypothetical protein
VGDGNQFGWHSSVQLRRCFVVEVLEKVMLDA